MMAGQDAALLFAAPLGLVIALVAGWNLIKGLI
jgi:predicted MFS family arabinose efflux permease